MSEMWYSRSFRRNLVDMHIDDWNPEFLSQFDPKAYFECLKTAHIQTPMIYIHSHVGLCNWDSDSGKVHNTFAGHNKIRELFDLCHADGMSVVAYYSLIYNNWAYEAYPAWRMLNAEGRGSREVGSRYGYICPNSMEYREFLKKQFAELTAEYDFEGIFLDMTFWPQVCYCDNCRNKFRQETGEEIPTQVDWNDPVWVSFQQARQRWIGEFAAYCTALIRQMKPGAAVEHQFSTICHDWSWGIDESVNLSNDYTGGDLYGGPLSQSYISKVFMEATENAPFEYMTSRCDPRLNVHTTTKTLYDLKLHNYLTLAHHGAFLVIDAIDPVGTLDKHVYETVGKVFEESMPYESYLKGDLVAEAALIMGYDSKYNADAKAAPATKADRSHPQLQAQLGAARALHQMRVLYTALPGNRIDRVMGKRLAMVTDAPSLREKELDTLERYVREGGNLYISGNTDPKLAERLLGLVFKGKTPENMTYAAPTELGRTAFGDEYSAKYPVSYEGPQPMMENPQNHPVLARITLPYTNPADSTRFASIHSNPPGRPTEYPAAILAQVGKGKVLWLSFCPEKASSASLHALTRHLIGLLYQPQILASTAHPCLEYTLFEDEEGYTLHAVNVQEEPALPLPAYELRLTLPRQVSCATLAPDDTPIDLRREGDTVILTMPTPDMFTTIRLK